MSSLHNIPHLTPMSSLHKIPPDACQIKTPLIKEAWLHHLQSYHHRDLAQYFLDSISNGFQIGFQGANLQSANKNLQSATAHPNIVEEYLKHELSLGRMSGPYPISVCPDVHVSSRAQMNKGSNE